MGVVQFSGGKRYEGVWFNVISVTRGWVGGQFPEKKLYVTFEWPPSKEMSLARDHNRQLEQLRLTCGNVILSTGKFS